ncbi:hypothetical protein OMP38_12285 [Cohnella ginsengisoli]|uniref:Hydrolase n=1 Tax=Cohnella ginsengisoli TaxID=425004 RepID=A0A9X4KKX3_9BACL|nr:hypothetical protein [Cohnella ginsengisoli]MDG0791565.1 hypothetical protein [Cohnella ginsengisoli]
MEKKKYYVSMQSRSIFNEQGQAPYELEIEATDFEITNLRQLFNDWEEADQATFFRTVTPGLPYHHDPQNDRYDQLLKECYTLIYEWGTEDTKHHLNSFLQDLQMGHHQEE